MRLGCKMLTKILMKRYECKIIKVNNYGATFIVKIRDVDIKSNKYTDTKEFSRDQVRRDDWMWIECDRVFDWCVASIDGIESSNIIFRDSAWQGEDSKALSKEEFADLKRFFGKAW